MPWEWRERWALLQMRSGRLRTALHVWCVMSLSPRHKLLNTVKNVNPNAPLVHLDQRFQLTSYTARGRQVRWRQRKLTTTPFYQIKGNLFHPDP